MKKEQSNKSAQTEGFKSDHTFAAEQYRMLFNSADEGFCIMELIYDQDGEIADFVFREVNPAFTRQTGLHDVAGKTVGELLPNFKQFWIDVYKKVSETGEAGRQESYMQDVDRWFMLCASRLGSQGSRLIALVFHDITERKKAEEALRESEERMRRIMNVEGVGVQLFDPETGTLLEANDGFLQLTGYTRVQVASGKLTWRTMTPPEYVAESEAQMKALAATGRIGPYEKELFRVDGSRLWMLFTGTALGDGTVVEYCVDISDRKQAEAALRQSENKYRSLFQSIDDGFGIAELMYDKDGKAINYRFLEVNEAFGRQTGVKGATGKTESDIAPDTEPYWVELYDKVARSGEAKRFESYHSPTQHWYSGHVTRVGGEGSYQVCIVFEDITERKEREEQQAFLLKLSDELRPIADPSEIKLAATRLLGEQLGVNRAFYLEAEGDYWMIADMYEADVKPVKRSHHLIEAYGWWMLDELRAGRRLVFSDSGTDDRFDLAQREAHQGLQIIGALVIPLVKEGRLVSALVLHSAIPRDWSERDMALADEVAERTWAVVEQARAEAALREAELQYRIKLEAEVRDRTAELKLSRDRLQSIFDTTLVQMSILEAVRDEIGNIVDFRILIVNKELEKETGRSDLVGKLYMHQYPGIKSTGLFDLIVKAIETGQPQSTEYFYRHDGFHKWYSCMFVKLNDGVVATNMDITAQKEAAEERFKNYLLLQQSEDVALLGSWEYNLMSGVFTWSDGMYRLFDLKKGTEVQPEIYLKYATAEGLPAAERVVNHLRNGDTDFEETLEISVGRKMSVLHLKATVVRNNEGHATRVLGVDIDISAMRAAEEKIRKIEAEQQLEIFRVSLSTLEEERHRISESLHNGIGQILYGIKLSLGSLKQRSETQEFKQAKAYTSKLLTEAIVETRRISHELMPTTLEAFGLKSAINDVCNQLSDRIQFTCHIRGLTDRLEKYLELAVYRTVQELMINVVKHANATLARVYIDIEPETIRIEVSDNGRGMQVSKKQKPGIGLASIRSKIQLLNGDLQIDSSPAGTSINVFIPVPQKKT